MKLYKSLLKRQNSTTTIQRAWWDFVLKRCSNKAATKIQASWRRYSVVCITDDVQFFMINFQLKHRSCLCLIFKVQALVGLRIEEVDDAVSIGKSVSEEEGRNEVETGSDFAAGIDDSDDDATSLGELVAEEEDGTEFETGVDFEGEEEEVGKAEVSNMDGIFIGFVFCTEVVKDSKGRTLCMAVGCKKQKQASSGETSKILCASHRNEWLIGTGRVKSWYCVKCEITVPNEKRCGQCRNYKPE